MVEVTSWGRLTRHQHRVIPVTDRNQPGLSAAPGSSIAHGMGRSYGDVCLNGGGAIWQMRGLDRLISFDQGSGRLRCEAGVLLQDIQRLMIPRGWMLPVTPGTQIVTVGGAIANDVHGKNHHVVGSFGDCVTRLCLHRTSGEVIECGPELEQDWFAATVGGIGLTGVITEVELQLRATRGPWLSTETIPYDSLDEFFALADDSESGWEHTVSWIDCLAKQGRGIFMRGNHVGEQDMPLPRARSRSVPVTPPVSVINRLTLPPMNWSYYQLQKRRRGTGTAHYESFFYPLDNLHDWNRLYGPRGFYQYQCVLPRESGESGIAAMLSAISRSGEGSFLAVLKTFGNREALGMLSFPRPGVTLALDFPNHGHQTLKLFEALDSIVAEAGGRLYPAKDARMPRHLFEAGYPGLDNFISFRDPGISSEMSRRLMGS
ncbi:FAD-binding oxidoreductase [Larsenimonas rhizosphaerae]|uniref:FAD-binding oxidoreductase n=1 Tax=Larsenimonas rhizosphaerae TaxID=2944682 RepID=UPI002033F1B6|nr:FAD-binding oxidoreductase [Larsenimonas rhizosphaerae]MCM2131855.1 FAD-binding oxidoreductase [Larsenimonas rhizosphaerae]